MIRAPEIPVKAETPETPVKAGIQAKAEEAAGAAEAPEEVPKKARFKSIRER